MSEAFDVVVIGAGLSGIGAAVHLRRQCPEQSFILLEMRERVGGTWDLFRFPGIRSDSDMFTLGYPFKPWTGGGTMASGADIRAYIQETAREYGVEQRIRFRKRVLGLDWCSQRARWRLTVQDLETHETVVMEARFVLCCAGYYNYERGYQPSFAGQAEFSGTLVHPQFWPQELDVRGRRVVVIGSGATAVTLLPALAERGAQVTMLQRSPSYVLSLPGEDRVARLLRRIVSERRAYGLARAKNILLNLGFYKLTRAYPKQARRALLQRAREALGEDFDMKHFSPRYNVWDERLCAVPDDDLFRALRSGKAQVVTDQIERFVTRGIRLESGRTLEADIIVTATGLELQLLGGAELKLNGETVQVSDKLYYKGAMLEDVPNLALVFGYTNASWTLKADLIQDYFCRLINYVEDHGFAVATPRRKGVSAGSAPFLDLNSGYVRRALDRLPKQGNQSPWKLYQNYLLDFAQFKLSRINDGALQFERASSRG